MAIRVAYRLSHADGNQCSLKAKLHWLPSISAIGPNWDGLCCGCKVPPHHRTIRKIQNGRQWLHTAGTVYIAGNALSVTCRIVTKRDVATTEERPAQSGVPETPAENDHLIVSKQTRGCRLLCLENCKLRTAMISILWRNPGGVGPGRIL